MNNSESIHRTFLQASVQTAKLSKKIKTFHRTCQQNMKKLVNFFHKTLHYFPGTTRNMKQLVISEDTLLTQQYTSTSLFWNVQMIFFVTISLES